MRKWLPAGNRRRARLRAAWCVLRERSTQYATRIRLATSGGSRFLLGRPGSGLMCPGIAQETRQLQAISTCCFLLPASCILLLASCILLCHRTAPLSRQSPGGFVRGCFRLRHRADGGCSLRASPHGGAGGKNEGRGQPWRLPPICPIFPFSKLDTGYSKLDSRQLPASRTVSTHLAVGNLLLVNRRPTSDVGACPGAILPYACFSFPRYTPPPFSLDFGQGEARRALPL